MSKTIAYIRASTDKQDVKNQRHEILEAARKKGIKVDDFIEITMSSGTTNKQRRIAKVLQTLEDSDTLIVTGLSRLGRSTPEVIALVNGLIKRSIRLIALREKLDISANQYEPSKITVTLIPLFAALEPDLTSLRTKEALSAKQSQEIQRGKGKGTIQKSKFDKDREKIRKLLKDGLSVRKIAYILGDGTNYLTLNTYVNKRKLRE